MRIFGSKAFALDKQRLGGKLSSKASPCVLMGYSDKSKAYRIWSSKQRKIIVSRDVKFFDEPGLTENHEVIITQKEKPSENEFVKTYYDNNEIDSETHKKSKIEQSIIQENEIIDTPKSTDTQDENELQEQQLKRERGRPKIQYTRLTGRPRKLYQTTDKNVNKNGSIIDKGEDTFYANIITDQIPETRDDVIKSNNVETWQPALEEEYLALLKHETWEIIERPNDQKVIRNRLVLQNEDNNKKKVRLVAKGCAQRFGIDYIETYSLVVKMTSIRLLSAIAAERDLEIH